MGQASEECSRGPGNGKRLTASHMLPIYMPNAVHGCRILDVWVLRYTVPIAERHFQMCYLFSSSASNNAIGTDSGLLEKPCRSIVFVFLPHNKSIRVVRKSAKFRSSDRIYFKFFSQASIKVIVSLEESDHCVWSHHYGSQNPTWLLREMAKIKKTFWRPCLTGFLGNVVLPPRQ